MGKSDIVDILTSLEQFETSLEHFAPLIATYYRAMVLNDIPDELARELTLEWHQLYWVHALGMNRTGNDE